MNSSEAHFKYEKDLMSLENIGEFYAAKELAVNNAWALAQLSKMASINAREMAEMATLAGRAAGAARSPSDLAELEDLAPLAELAARHARELEAALLAVEAEMAARGKT